MSVNGFGKSEERRDGGLYSLRLAAAGDVLAVKYDKASDSFTELVFKSGVVPACYEFDEDTALYRQRMTGVYPYEKVVHELSFSMARLDDASVRSLSELLSDNNGGFIALATTMTGGTFLAGWSTEFEEECPLRLVAASADSRSDYGDDSFCRVELRSEDIAFSKLFTGSVG